MTPQITLKYDFALWKREGGGILASITEDEIFESLSIVRYGLKYLNLTGIGVYDFWAKIFGPKDDNPQ